MKPATPQQHTGAMSDTTHSITTPTGEQAAQLFRKARKNLMMVNAWEELTGKPGASFELTDREGKPARRAPQPGDYFKINIPGPGSENGQGYDWVQVEAVEDDLQNPEDTHMAIRVRPAASPQGEKEACHHFFTKDATSTFCVQRKGNTVTAGVYGRNEKPNTHTNSFFDTVRNAVVGFLAMLGLNKPQWAGLVKGILEKDADAITFQK